MPPSHSLQSKASQTEFRKRQQIFAEFIYYMFDSFLIPLIRSNFHVTESNSHRNQLFFFRHDVWRLLSEPVLASLRHTMFEEIPTERANRMLDSRALGFSQIRLLPKKAGVRPIMNLRRRVMNRRNRRVFLGRSINSILAPVHNMLCYEKVSLASSRI